MVASDTVVGIVGAVVLVAVMAGVFVYEYNNPNEASEDMESAAAHLFADTYPDLDASEDIDMDGINNLNDTDDLDGDGTANANDTEISVLVPLTGQRPQLLPGGTDPGVEFPVFVGTGAVHIVGTLTYQTTTPAQLPQDHTLAVELRDADGGSAASATATRSGMTVTVTFEATELPAGNYTVVVRQTSIGQATAFNGSVYVHYPAPAALDHEHDE